MSISNEISKTLKIAAENAEAAYRNEQLTRERVESLERILGGLFALPLRSRLRWVLFGFPPPTQKPTQAPQVADEPAEKMAADVD
jgi:hypothetical protein